MYRMQTCKIIERHHCDVVDARNATHGTHVHESWTL